MEERCGFYVKRKRRFCKMLPAKGNKYCAEHLCEDSDYKGSLARVQCPLDPKHSVFKHKLEKHLKKCNALGKTQQIFFEEGINAGDESYIYPNEETIPLSNVSKQELNDLVRRLKEANARLIEPAKLNYVEHSVLAGELDKEEYGPSTKKHLRQQSSIVSLLEKNGALLDDACFIEFGAGKGKLMHWVEKAMPPYSKAHFYLVDKQNNRHKYDCYHKGTDQGAPFNRLYIDIKDLNIGKVQGVHDHQMTIGLGKHLCGAATDFTLRCLLPESYLSGSTRERSPPCKKVKTTEEVVTCLPDLVLVALCCHHRCTWPSYVGKDFLLKHGFTSLDFHRLTALTSWALCGFRHRDHEASLKNDNADTEPNVEVLYAREKKEQGSQEKTNSIASDDIRTSSKEEKEEIGKMAKRLIDYGRLDYLRAFHFTAELVLYVPEDVTPENVVLLAKKHHMPSKDMVN